MNSIRLIFSLAISLVFASAAFAQPATPGSRSDQILLKARDIDLLNHLLPLLLTKDQINGILPLIEKCRKKVKDVEAEEAKDLASLEGEIDAAVSKGIKEQLVPPKTIINKLTALFTGFTIRRQAAANENADFVLPELKKILKAGQWQTAVHTIDPSRYDPKIDVKTMSENDRVKFFIKDVILDPNTYPLLIKILKERKD